MISKLINRLKHRLDQSNAPVVTPEIPQCLSQRDLIKRLSAIPSWDKKIEVYDLYEYNEAHGNWQKKNALTVSRGEFDSVLSNETGMSNNGSIKVNYGCGGNLIADWLNIDLYQSDAKNYRMINLLDKHPFRDNSVSFGFSEDVLEHLSQAESVFFLSEIYRALKDGGVLRLSFPGLEGVLKRHYSPYSETRVRQGEFEAYSFWDHIHFYSEAELALVAEHIGYKAIEFVKYGKSVYPELTGLDTRVDQIGLNTYVELTK